MVSRVPSHAIAPSAFLPGNLDADLDDLAGLRDGLRARVRNSPLCDYDGFARNLEAAYRDMWRTWCATPKPAIVNVNPPPATKRRTVKPNVD